MAFLLPVTTRSTSNVGGEVEENHLVDNVEVQTIPWSLDTFVENHKRSKRYSTMTTMRRITKQDHKGDWTTVQGNTGMYWQKVCSIDSMDDENSKLPVVKYFNILSQYD